MSSERNTRGVARVLAKLESSIACGNYYEAHQMYRTLYFRYIGQKKYSECLELLYSGALKFLNNEQYSSGADLALLVIDTLEKSATSDYELWFQRLGVLIRKTSPSTVERESIITRAVKWSGDVSSNNLGHPVMHKIIAQITWAEGNVEQARHHYLLSRDGHSYGHMLVELSQSKGYSNEVDLFIVQVVLQQLCLKELSLASTTLQTYTKFHPKIACTEPPFVMPVLNFLYFLLKIIETGRLATFKKLCQLYKASLDRDPSYEKYLQKIGVIFFGAAPPQQPGLAGMGGLFGDIFSRLFTDLTDDEEEQRPRTSQQRNQRASNAGLD